MYVTRRADDGVDLAASATICLKRRLVHTQQIGLDQPALFKTFRCLGTGRSEGKHFFPTDHLAQARAHSHCLHNVDISAEEDTRNL